MQLTSMMMHWFVCHSLLPPTNSNKKQNNPSISPAIPCLFPFSILSPKCHSLTFLFSFFQSFNLSITTLAFTYLIFSQNILIFIVYILLMVIANSCSSPPPFPYFIYGLQTPAKHIICIVMFVVMLNDNPNCYIKLQAIIVLTHFEIYHVQN